MDQDRPPIPDPARDPASFRDPSGFVYRDGQGRLCRQVNECYAAQFGRLLQSGLYAELVEAGLLIEHSGPEVAARPLTIYPREVPFVSYPYEWSFSMLQDAALLTLALQQRALARGLWLKDASAYNVQFEGAKPIFIDTLSFEPLPPGKPWVAYGQFCRHFLAPLALMSWTDARLGRLLETHLDGVPLDLAVRLLPVRAFFHLGLFLHLRTHARAVGRHQRTQRDARASKAAAVQLSAKGLTNLVQHLEQTVRKLRLRPAQSEWVDYYQDHSYTRAMWEEKVRWLTETLQKLQPRTVWDLGANTGFYSRLASAAGASVVAMDMDPGCVERNYLEGRTQADKRVLPLWLDLTNPSPGLGWANRERRSLSERGPADVLLALALVHHLAIGNNVPLAWIGRWFRRLARHTIVEFVPKDDPQAQRLLQSRQDVFADYTQEQFETAFGRHFHLAERRPVADSGRVLYLFVKKERGSADDEE